jgi:hypothetical protein
VQGAELSDWQGRQLRGIQRAFLPANQLNRTGQVIDKDFARRLAAEHIEEGRTNAEGIIPVIVDDETIEKDFGWIFFYQALEYLETQDSGFQLLGNAPIIVDRADGSLHETGTAEPIEHYIRDYEKSRKVE